MLLVYAEKWTNCNECKTLLIEHLISFSMCVSRFVMGENENYIAFIFDDFVTVVVHKSAYNEIRCAGSSRTCKVL